MTSVRSTLASVPLLLLVHAWPASLPSVLASDAWSQARDALADYDELRALPWIRQAADEGDRHAQLVLGLLLIHGRRVFGSHFPADREEGIAWLRRAADNRTDTALGVPASRP